MAILQACMAAGRTGAKPRFLIKKPGKKPGFTYFTF
jgi:hypothetical protein